MWSPVHRIRPYAVEFGVSLSRYTWPAYNRTFITSRESLPAHFHPMYIHPIPPLMSYTKRQGSTSGSTRTITATPPHHLLWEHGPACQYMPSRQNQHLCTRQAKLHPDQVQSPA